MQAGDTENFFFTFKFYSLRKVIVILRKLTKTQSKKARASFMWLSLGSTSRPPKKGGKENFFRALKQVVNIKLRTRDKHLASFSVASISLDPLDSWRHRR